jgi:hypothetical protein
MCDYSLQGIRNRLAEEGETLVVHRFHSGSKGLTSLEYLEPSEQPKGWMTIIKKMFASPASECAVCVPDGAQIVLHGIPLALQHRYGLCATEPVIFRQTSIEAVTYRDALEFKNGAMVRLQDLVEGQEVEVLALSSEQNSIPDGVEFQGRTPI